MCSGGSILNSLTPQGMTVRDEFGVSDREATPLAPLLISLSSCSPFCSLSLFFFKFYLPIFTFGCAGFLGLRWLSSSCSQQGLPPVAVGRLLGAAASLAKELRL